MSNSKVPVTIITGFLGSGKTTFLQKIIAGNHGKLVAIIQNEFAAATGLDLALVMEVSEADQIEYVEYVNGCLCCSAKKGLALTIEKMMQKRLLDMIFIETSGLADPGPIIAELWLDRELDSEFYLASTIVFVDADNVNKHQHLIEFNRQLVVADCIVLNKIELIDDDRCLLLTDQIRKINTLASVITASYSNVDLDYVLSIRAYDSNLVLSQLNEQCYHTADMMSVCIELATDIVSKSHLEQVIGSILWEDDQTQAIVRIKGIIAIKNKNKKYAIQSVYQLLEIRPTNIEWKLNEPRVSKMIFIGHNLNPDHLIAQITS